MADWYFRNRQKQNLEVCPGCRNLVRKGQEFCPFCARRLGPESGVGGMLKRVRDEVKQRFFGRPDAVTRLLLGMMVVMFLVQLGVDLLLPSLMHGTTGEHIERFSIRRWIPFLTVTRNTYILLGANDTGWVLEGQVWRLVTYCFLHIGLLHILFNGWAMWDLGRLVERMWGGAQLFATFILTGIAGGAASCFVGEFVLGSPRLSAGASGAICGALGLLLGAYYKNRYHVGEYLGAQLLRWAIYILVFGLVAGADNSAHIGGMLAGAAIGYFLPPTQTTRTAARDAKAWRALLAVSAVLFVAAYVCAAFFAVGMLAQARGA